MSNEEKDRSQVDYHDIFPDKTYGRGMALVGNAFWRTIHCYAAGYHPSQMSLFINFLTFGCMLLPCYECKTEAHKWMTNLKDQRTIHMKDNHSLFKWTYDFHDSINKKIGKTSPPYERVKSAYFESMGRTSTILISYDSLKDSINEKPGSLTQQELDALEKHLLSRSTPQLTVLHNSLANETRSTKTDKAEYLLSRNILNDRDRLTLEK